MNNNLVRDDWYTEKTCRTCGKRFTVLHPSRWAYKKTKNGKWYQYFCTWKCLREYEKGNEGKKTMSKTNDAKQRTDRRDTLINLIAAFEEERKAPLEFLKEEGYKNADSTWYELKEWAKKNSPEMYKKLTDLKLIRPAAEVTASKKLPAEAQNVTLVYDPSIKEEYEQDLEKRKEDAEREERGRRIAEGLDRADRKRREMINGIETLEVAAVYSRVLKDATFKKINGGMALCGISISSVIMMSAYEWFRLSEEILVALRQLDATNPDMEV